MRLNNREVEVLETGHDDGWNQVLAAMFVDDETELTEEECLILEEQYQQTLAEDHYSSLIDAAHDMMSDR